LLQTPTNITSYLFLPTVYSEDLVGAQLTLQLIFDGSRLLPLIELKMLDQIPSSHSEIQHRKMRSLKPHPFMLMVNGTYSMTHKQDCNDRGCG
jgi:hypothetical protein